MIIMKKKKKLMRLSPQPFYENSLFNSSWEIARRLPSYLPATAGTMTSSTDNAACRSTYSFPPIRIHIHPDPIKVSYKSVRELVPTLWGSRKIDIVIHIGMAVKAKFYSIERLAHRDGYLMLDVDSVACPDLVERMTKGKDWIWYGLPEELLSDINIDRVFSIWQTLKPAADVRVSNDPGRFLCDFIYFSSLAELAKRCKPKKVIFLHVPEDTNETSINTGVKITVQLIKAIVQSEILDRKH
ncbi:Pyroglutamyl-peptidase 1 [Golovinomyces cichoracearum]|uniref:Pyroglutamyl-peptidase 1 n=1 Tax=Golovinomyces cichoracearum TaxID=62708 RepID=A0A420IV63_9PEZI|nr:Pyroglutamyl-peptidase 1 [Golovinomyces cichoracearum]